MKRILYDNRSLFSSFKSFKLKFFGSAALRKGIEGVVIIGIFFHVSEHVDHFKVIISYEGFPWVVWLVDT